MRGFLRQSKMFGECYLRNEYQVERYITRKGENHDVSPWSQQSRGHGTAEQIRTVWLDELTNLSSYYSSHLAAASDIEDRSTNTQLARRRIHAVVMRYRQFTACVSSRDDTSLMLIRRFHRVLSVTLIINPPKTKQKPTPLTCTPHSRALP